jgi:hypothetical protein
VGDPDRHRCLKCRHYVPVLFQKRPAPPKVLVPPIEVPAPRAANPIQELQIGSGTGINRLAGAHDFPKFVEVGAAIEHELQEVGTSRAGNIS